jgi:hypothetical protein
MFALGYAGVPAMDAVSLEPVSINRMEIRR